MTMPAQHLIRAKTQAVRVERWQEIATHAHASLGEMVKAIPGLVERPSDSEMAVAAIRELIQLLQKMKAEISIDVEMPS